MAIVPFQAFAESSLRGIVEKHAIRDATMHLVECPTPSGSSRLHSSINLGSRN